MFSLLFRNRWMGLVWGVLMISAGVIIAIRGFGPETEAVQAAPSATPQDEFARWAEEPSQNSQAQNGPSQNGQAVSDTSQDQDPNAAPDESQSETAQ